MRDNFDAIVVGAGAAGLAAARRLMAAGREIIVLEAGNRIGGRAWTVEAAGAPIDLGCGWLHSADRNPLVPIVEKLGFSIDKSKPPWQKQSFGLLFAPGEQDEFRKANAAFDARQEAAAKTANDAPASTQLEPGNRWNPLLNAISTYYNGVELDRVSLKDFAEYTDTEVNWRVREGYGAFFAAYGRHVPVMLDCPATRVAWGGEGVRVSTPKGDLSARAVVIAVPPTVIAKGRIQFDPLLPDKDGAASALPLGVVEKVFLQVAEPEQFPVDGHLFAAIDRTKTGSYHLRPFGRPLIECFFAGDLACELDMQGAGAFVDFALQEITSLLGEDMRAKLSFVAQSRWLADPYIGGAYSHAKPGHAGARMAFTAPVAEPLYFAGEHCSPHFFSTAHGAYESGIAAAEALLARV